MKTGAHLSGIALFLAVCGARGAETSAVVTSLPPVVVTAPAIRDAGWQMPGDAVAASAESLPTVVVNSQGGAGAQNDISIQGSSFSGAGLSVAGLALRNPQTEHFHGELPLPASVLSSPKVLTGMDQARAAGAGHLVGSIGFDLAPLDSRMSIEAGAGERSHRWQSIVIQTPVAGEPGVAAVGVGGFAGHETADGLDWPGNDLDRTYGGGQAQVAGRDWRFDLIAGRQDKTFGARGYYGVTPAWDAEEEVGDTLILGSWRMGPAEAPRVRLSAAWREVEDRYQLFWTLPGVYENRHTSRMATAAADGIVPLAPGERFDAGWRIGYDREDLDSSALGDHDRARVTFSLIPRLTLDRVCVEAGVRAEGHSDDRPAWLPQTRVSWTVLPRHVLYASYTASVRQPSYTELNYDSPGSLGNQGLERQENHAFEAGYAGSPADTLTLRGAAFAHRGRNTVDWIREAADSTRWTAVDLGTVDTVGAQVDLTWAANRALDLRGGYVWIEKDAADPAPYASRYVLDYPEHMLRAAAMWRATKRSSLAAEQGLRLQTDSPVRASGRTAYPARVSLRHAPRWWRGAELAVALENAWNDDFEVLAGQPSPGRRASASLRLSW